jgi:hypothetical protein
MGCAKGMLIWSKGVEKRHLDPWTHLYMQPIAIVKQSWESPIIGGASHDLEEVRPNQEIGRNYEAANPAEPT